MNIIILYQTHIYMYFITIALYGYSKHAHYIVRRYFDGIRWLFKCIHIGVIL